MVQPRDDDPVQGNERSETRLQLASVRLLINSKRTVDFSDIMLATVFEELEVGPKNSEELFHRIRAAWPGAIVTRSMLDATLDAARERHLVETIVQLDNRTSWGLAAMGRDELGLSKEWANDIIERAAVQIQLDARHFFATTDSELALRWAAILFRVLMWGIASAFTSGEGGITLIDDRFLFPDTYNLEAMDQKLNESCKDPEVLRFLKAELRAALDPSVDFATELVHYVSTGYVLYAYIGHRDHAEARVRVGTFANETVILDTPMLVQLLSDQGGGRSAQEILKIAHQQGVRMIVDPATIDEFVRVVESRTDEALEIEKAIRSGADLGTLRFTMNDPILSAWLTNSPQSREKFGTWNDFQQRARSIQSTLKSLGIDCAGSSNWTPELNSDQGTLRSALKAELDAHGGGRGELQLDHDARLLAVAKRERDLNPESSMKIWPGAIIITTDTHMNATYSVVFGTQRFPVALTISQWAGLLGCFSPPVNAERLAFALTEEIPRRTILKGALQIPTETAIELARSVGGRDVSQPAMEEMQLSLQELLEGVPNPFAMSTDSARELARQVLTKHTQRSNRVSKELIELNRAEHERQIERLDNEIETVRSRDESDGPNDSRGEIQRLTAVSTRLKRSLCVTLIALFSTIAIFVLKGQNLEPGHRLGLSILGLVIFVGLGIDYSININRKWYEPIGGLIVAVALAVLPLFI